MEWVTKWMRAAPRSRQKAMASSITGTRSSTLRRVEGYPRFQTV